MRDYEKTQKCMFLFSRARTQNSSWQDSYVIHSATEVSNSRAFYISFIILLHVPNCEEGHINLMRRYKYRIMSMSSDFGSNMNKSEFGLQNLGNRDSEDYETVKDALYFSSFRRG